MPPTETIRSYQISQMNPDPTQPAQDQAKELEPDRGNLYRPHKFMINSGQFWRCKHGLTGFSESGFMTIGIMGSQQNWSGCDDCAKDDPEAFAKFMRVTPTHAPATTNPAETSSPLAHATEGQMAEIRRFRHYPQEFTNRQLQSDKEGEWVPYSDVQQLEAQLAAMRLLVNRAFWLCEAQTDPEEASNFDSEFWQAESGKFANGLEGTSGQALLDRLRKAESLFELWHPGPAKGGPNTWQDGDRLLIAAEGKNGWDFAIVRINADDDVASMDDYIGESFTDWDFDQIAYWIHTSDIPKLLPSAMRKDDHE